MTGRAGDGVEQLVDETELGEAHRGRRVPARRCRRRRTRLLGRLEHDVAARVAVERVDHVDDRRDALVGDPLLEDAEAAGVAEAERAVAQLVGCRAEVDGSPSGRSGTPVWPTRAPGAMPVTSATAEELGGRAVQAGAGRPDPDGDRERRRLRRAPAAPRSRRRSTTAPREFTCRTRACGAVAASSGRSPCRWRRRRSGRSSPLTCSTSTGPGSAHRRPGRADGAAAGGEDEAQPAAPSRAIASLRKGASGARRSCAAADRRPRDDRGGQGGRRQDHGNGSAGPSGCRRRAARARRRARRQAGAGGARSATCRARSSPAPAALEEYLREHGFGRVARRLTTSGVIDVVATAAPGHRRHRRARQDQAARAQRRVGRHRRRRPGRRSRHHVPARRRAGLLDAVRGGPVRAQADDVLELLGDPARCQVVLVTLPETTPVNEVVETAYALEDRVGVRLGPVVVNSVDDLGGTGVPDPAGVDLRGHRGRRPAASRRPRSAGPGGRCSDAEIARLGERAGARPVAPAAAARGRARHRRRGHPGGVAADAGVTSAGGGVARCAPSATDELGAALDGAERRRVLRIGWCRQDDDGGGRSGWRRPRAGRRAVVVTIDPARRLADALGLPGGLAAEPQRIELPDAAGELWAMMLDTATAFDGLVRRERRRRRAGRADPRPTRSTATSPAPSAARRSTWRPRRCTSCTPTSASTSSSSTRRRAATRSTSSRRRGCSPGSSTTACSGC